MKRYYRIFGLIMMLLVGGISQAQVSIPTENGELTVFKHKRVITLEHRYTEMVLSLGIIPVGVADIKSYMDYDGVFATKLKDTKDVGRRAAPNIEAMARLKPDVIIGTYLRNTNAFALLQKVAPTLLFSYIQVPEDHKSPLNQMLYEFNLVAKALGKQKKAKEVLKQYQQKIAKARQTITQLKAKGLLKSDRIAIAQFLPGSPKVRLFTTDSVAMDALKQVGLKPAWQVKAGEAGMGYLTVGINTLRPLGVFNFFYFNERSDDSQLQRTIHSKLWQSFGFVKADLAFELGQKSWPWGGPVAVADFVLQITDILVKKSHQHAI
ncbi:ABC transporter substrate-binding protein [Facilibium subflavum]|uniref:ABC transporter substrate-binding protein n=1 Tax=Facilibium subflavum TaxID=2219058 RepID=UPI000E656D37|nr:iron-siderophore ABC transporter substrate-binding protein [Facilibium subflavum]